MMESCPHCDKPIKLSKGLPTFESTAPFDYGPEAEPPEIRRNLWASDGVTYSIAGVFVGATLLSFSWWYNLDAGVFIAGGALFTGVGLHILKLILYRPRPASADPVASGQTTIKVEHWDQERGHVTLNEFQDKRITLSLLKTVAKAIIVDEVNFSKPQLTKYSGISQRRYDILKSEFYRLNFCYTDKANRTHLLRSGRAFLRTVQDSA